MDGLIGDIDVLEREEKKDEVDVRSISGNSLGSKKLYIESYGCQMNFSDSEIVSSILHKEGFITTKDIDEADLVLINTCSIRDKAEQTVRNRLQHFQSAKARKPEMTVGVLGCMAERLKKQLLDEEKIVDLVVGPDAYRDLPALVEEASDGRKGVNTFLSREETYDDIVPLRLNSNGVTAFISIMRGCDNMCSFCVVPFTRGRERSRDPYSIVTEAENLYERGFREVTLLGQNVDSYKWSPNTDLKGKAQIERSGEEDVITFAQLLRMVARVNPLLRVRFSTSHPKDITDDVLYAMREFDNICKHIHLPAQSGNSRVLDLMNRTYDREWYVEKVDRIRDVLGPDCGLSSDMISGFCTESEEEHGDTLSLMEYVKYDFSFMFNYSERPGTLAAKKYEDDIPEDVKKRRLSEIIALQQQHSFERHQRDIGKVQEVLVEGPSKRSEDFMQGRNTANKVVVFPKDEVVKGQYVQVKITDCTSATLLGEIARN